MLSCESNETHQSFSRRIGNKDNTAIYFKSVSYCFKSVFCWQTITPLNWSLIFIRHLYEPYFLLLVVKKHKVILRFSRSTLLLIPIFESNFVQLISEENDIKF